MKLRLLFCFNTMFCFTACAGLELNQCKISVECVQVITQAGRAHVFDHMLENDNIPPWYYHSTSIVFMTLQLLDFHLKFLGQKPKFL